MAIYLAGVEYSEVHVGGVEFSGLQLRGQSYLESDTPGTLTVTARRVGGATTFALSITDPNGIRSITSATLIARDGQRADALGDFSRSDANTFAGTDRRANARWRRGSLTVVYVDATSGTSHTLTQTWSV